MVALGIPGDGVTAMLLGGLMIHGIQPGPLLFTNNPSIVYALFLTALIAAVLVLVLQYFGMRLFPAILKIPYHYLYPLIVVLGFVGVYVGSSTAFNYVLLIAFAALGLLMDKVRLPVGPFILAFILGPMLELNLRRGITYTDDGILRFSRGRCPACCWCSLLSASYGPICGPGSRSVRKRRAMRQADRTCARGTHRAAEFLA